MKYCPACKVSVTGYGACCPLCQGELRGEGEPSPFPTIETTRTHKLFLRLLVFISLVSVLICVIVDHLIPTTVAWSWFVVAGVACVWLSLGIALRKRRDLLKNISWQAFVISMLSIGWDVFTRWRGWSVNYVVPCVFLVMMLLTPLLARILRLPRSAYLVYFCLVAGFGLIPAIFLLTGLVTVPLPSLLSVGASLISLVAMCVFSGPVLLEELHRRFHL